MGRYRRIETRIWTDARVRSLSRPEPCGQFLWVRLLTGPETVIIPGVIVTTRAGLAEKLRWSVEGFDAALAELIAAGLARESLADGLLWIPKAIAHNPPPNPNVVKAWGKEWPEVPECDLKCEIYREMLAHFEGLSEPFRKAFAKSFGNPLPKHPESFPKTGSGSGCSTQDQDLNPPDAPRPKAKKKPIELSHESIEIAQYLYDSILTHRPDFMANAPRATLERKLRGWAKAIDVGIRQDGITVEGAKKAIAYAHRRHLESQAPGVDFWHGNLQSGDKLRKHYEALLTKANPTPVRRADAQPFDPRGIDYTGIRDKIAQKEGKR